MFSLIVTSIHVKHIFIEQYLFHIMIIYLSGLFYLHSLKLQPILQKNKIIKKIQCRLVNGLKNTNNN